MELVSTEIEFSIVIPTYNRSELIGHTLDSIIKQTFPSFEIIVVDDGSTDNTKQVVGSQERYKPIHYYYIENGERGRARNFGFAKSKGKYVLFLDSDDLLIENHLEVLKAKIDQLGQPNYIATKYCLKRGEQVKTNEIGEIKEGWYGVDLFLKGNILACNICVRRDNPNLKLFEEDRKFAVVEDWMFMLQNFVDNQFYLIDNVTIIMNDHDFRSMRSDDRILIGKFLLALEWIKVNIPLSKDQYEILVRQVYYLCAIHAYSGNDRVSSVKFLSKAISSRLETKFLVLFSKILVGKKTVDFVKSIRN